MEPAGIIPLKQARVEVPKDRPLFIQVNTINNTEYVMQAETEKDAELWGKKITNAIIKENQKWGLPSPENMTFFYEDENAQPVQIKEKKKLLRLI